MSDHLPAWRALPDNAERLRAHLAAEALGNQLDIRYMTVEEFRALPVREDEHDPTEFTSFVIIPGVEGDEHESGWRCFDVVGVRGSFPVCRISGGSDHLEFNEVAWRMDCLKKSGLLHFWFNATSGETRAIKFGPSFSSLEVIGLRRPVSESPSSNTQSGR